MVEGGYKEGKYQLHLNNLHHLRSYYPGNIFKIQISSTSPLIMLATTQSYADTPEERARKNILQRKSLALCVPPVHQKCHFYEIQVRKDPRSRITPEAIHHEFSGPAGNTQSLRTIQGSCCLTMAVTAHGYLLASFETKDIQSSRALGSGISIIQAVELEVLMVSVFN